ncbi:unnamed protein product [Litomosoides sigmodontis]|uniref:Uncharacterized protein n=1 Tax=Litomosoides sigmodontis TaxID=42156 RepID=A0A3P6SVV6_LITSI|nr:unnamed protein product [Litomosoides sigmodontis]
MKFRNNAKSEQVKKKSRTKSEQNETSQGMTIKWRRESNWLEKGDIKLRMFEQDGGLLGEYCKNVKNVVDLLRFRLMKVVRDELNSFYDTVTYILDGITAQDEGSLITTSREDMTESESDSDEEVGVTATVVTEQCEEIVVEERGSRSENYQVSVKPELSYEEPEHFSNPQSTELIVHKILLNATKIVNNMLADAERNN